MNIIDLGAFVGNWPFRPVNGQLRVIRDKLVAYGTSVIFVSPLEAAWYRNPHLANGPLYAMTESYDDVWPVPVIDPTVITWSGELDRAAAQEKVRLVRLLPAYSSYSLASVSALLDAIMGAGLGVVVQTRLEDPRRQHPLAQVPDIQAAEIVEAAEKCPESRMIIGGARTAELRNLARRIEQLPNLYADVSQCDGLDAVKMLAEAGLADKLVFGSHAPLFEPYAAFARVTTGMDESTTYAVLGGNAARFLGWV